MAAETHSTIHIHTSQVFVTVSAAKGEAFNKICKLKCDCFNERRKALKKFTPDTLYTNHFLHQTPPTPDIFLQFTNDIFYKKPFTPANVYTKRRLHETSFYTSHLLHQSPFTLHQVALFSKEPEHRTTPSTFYTKQFLHQTTSTPDNF